MMAETDRQSIIATVLRRYPLPPDEHARAVRILHQAIDDGRVGDEVERYLVAWIERHPELRLTLERQVSRVAFAEEALALGAIYDGAYDSWTPPAGQSWDEFVATVAERLGVSTEDLGQLRNNADSGDSRQ